MSKIILKRTLTARWGTYEAGFSFDENQIVDITANALAEFIENSVQNKIGIPVDGDLTIIERKIGRKLNLGQEQEKPKAKIETVTANDSSNKESLTKDELKEIAKEQGIIIRGNPSKETLIQRIEAKKQIDNQPQD